MTNTPIPPPDQAAQGQTAAPAPVRRILLVDDNPSIRTMVALYFQSLRFQVVEVPNGNAAVRAASAGSYDLILMDLNLPIMDGMEATRRIRMLDGPGAGVPIIGMTAAHHDVKWPSCREAGMDQLVNKVDLLPALPDLLRRFIGDAATEPGAAAAARKPEPATRDAALGLDELRQRIRGVGAEEMSRLFARLKADADRQLDELALAWRAGRAADAAAIAHRLGGGAATFQMIGLHGLLVSLERAFQSPAVDAGEVSGLVGRLRAAWPRSVASFERFLESADYADS